MAWHLLPTDYTDAVWAGLKKYLPIENGDNTVSFQDVTVYSGKEKSFFGAQDANRMNEALNTIMSMLEQGTDLYETFQMYFDTQKALFTEKSDSEYSDFTAYVDDLKEQGDAAIQSIKTDYRDEIEDFESVQEQVFNVWFQAIQNQLSKDVAGHLQNECSDLDERLSLLERMVIQNNISAPIATDDDEITLITDDYGNAILAEWKHEEVY